jgi:hypothetical protein
MRRASAIAVLGGILIACSAHGQPAPAGAAAFHAKVAALYSFEPHTLTQQQIDAKSNALDQFWTEVKADPKRYRPLLRRELRDGSNPAYFSYDGAKLLLAISQDPKDRALALQSIPRVDLRGIQPTDYLRTVHSFAINGFDTTKAALRILDYPDFKAFIPQHALTLGQDYSLIYMLFPMPETKFVPALIERLGTEANVVSQKSILLALWYAVTPEAKAAAARFMSDASKPREARDYARELAEKKVHAQGAPAAATAEKLKEERRKALRRISDEALLEFDSLTVMLLTRQ